MTDHSDAASVEAVSPGRYRLDPNRSQVRYSSKHMFGMGTVQAVFTVQEGELHLGEPMTTSSATVTIAAASFASDNAKRDKDVRSAGLLDVDTYPHITFASERLQETPDGWLVTGDLTAHGQSVPVDVRIDRLTDEGNGIRVRGHVEHLDRTAFGITGSRGMVGRYFNLELDVFATAT